MKSDLNLQSVLQMWRKDCVIDDEQLDHESIRCALLHGKYLEILSAVRIKHDRLKHDQKKLYALKNRYFSGKMTKEEMDDLGWPYDPFNGEKAPMKSRMDDYIRLDPDIRMITESVVEHEVMAEALADIVNNINWRHQTIKNAIDFKRFTSGN